MLWRAVLVWFGLMVLAIANGAFRTSLLQPRLGERMAHILSTLLLASIILAVAWLCAPWLKIQSPRQAWTVGGLWLLLTLAFEFGAGHYLFGTPWPKLLADYNLLQGRIWPLILATTLLAPILVFTTGRR